MSLSRKGITVEDTKLSTTSKATSLNPNAAEFVPGSFRLSSGSGTVVAAQESHETSPFGKAVLDHSDSSVSKNSDDEAHQYWRHQLPDDITPDFQVTGEEESHRLGNLSLSELSLNDGGETSRFSASVGSQYPLNEWGGSSPTHNNGNRFSEKSRHSIQPYGEESLYLNFLRSTSEPWEKRFVRNDSLSSNHDAMPHNFNSGQSFLNDMFGEKAMLDNASMDPVEFLASQFPGFATKSLAEVYLANGCDLNLTIEMLSQLELQVDGSFRQNISPKTLSAPNLSSLDFPALPVPDDQNCVPKFSRDNAHENFNLYQSSEKDNTLLFKMNPSMPSRSTSDFASIVKKSHRNPSAWKDDRSRTPSASNDPNRSILAGSYSSVNGRGMYGDKLQSRGSARAAPLWVETGDAVENMYSELRGEARDYARIRNVYFEQATQAYLIGNKALAKELSMKGQLHNMQMKAAHGKAQESIYRQRNPVGRGQEKLIDLHGLHVTEAIHVLKQELSKLRSVARSAEQRMAVYICVGTGHHTRGSRTPARLPAAVQHYLLEDEGLDFSEPQPGLLLVVIY